MAEPHPILTHWKFQDLTGLPFGRLTVLFFAGQKGHVSMWHCRCLCGNETTVAAGSLKTGLTSSCGCLRLERVRDALTTHGQAGARRQTKEYRAWAQMIKRCYDPKYVGRHDYMDRGITVCERWRASFEAFFADMGLAPSCRHSLDRFPNNDGNYEPGNCRWATLKEQARNKRTNRRLTLHGLTLTVAEWSELTGIALGTIWHRVTRGWDAERALTTPVK